MLDLELIDRVKAVICGVDPGADALKKVTVQDFGEDQSKWQKWWDLVKPAP